MVLNFVLVLEDMFDGMRQTGQQQAGQRSFNEPRERMWGRG